MQQHKNQFLSETVVYQLLAAGGVAVPKYATIRSDKDVQNLSFTAGEKVVVKGLADNLWHKSDIGVLDFVPFDRDNILKLHTSYKKKLEADGYKYIETLVCAMVDFKTRPNLPAEGFVSIKWEDSCGYVVRMGLGGISTEFWAGQLNAGLVTWPMEMVTPEEAFLELKSHVLGRVWLGDIRQGKALTDNDKILAFLRGIWRSIPELARRGVQLMEMNPVVVNQNGEIVALDGVGEYCEPAAAAKSDQRAIPALKALVAPKKIAIAGVSAQPGSFGRVIFENLMLSDLDKSQLKVIKPNVEEMSGVRCYADISALKNDPVDILILALPAATSCKTVVDLCEQGAGAEVVYLVAGGIGDGADKDGHGQRMMETLKSRRAMGKYAPFLIGPNSLGIVLSPSRLNSLFISQTKLPVSFHPAGNIGFVSQSGAFFISRLSKETTLPIKYGFCIGNQIDVRVSDFLKVFSQDESIKTVGVYAEGFAPMDALEFAKTAQQLASRGRHVILYKGGRSTEGMKAASGHTGAMASDYKLHEILFKNAGIKVTETFQDFSAALAFYSHYPEASKVKKVGAISNAGFETVGIADFLGGRSLIHPFEGRERSSLEQMIKSNKLEGLVSVANPFDITPMASEQAYLESIAVMAQSDCDVVVVGIVPLTEKLASLDEGKSREFARSVKRIAVETKKPVIVVVDSGAIYDPYAKVLEQEGLATFRSMDIALSVLRR